MAEMLGVPSLSIGDEIMNYVCDTTRGKINLHDHISKAQRDSRDGEGVFTLFLTFPPVPDPVTISDLAWLGKETSRDELAVRGINVVGIICCTTFDFKAFITEIPQIIEDETWDLTDIPFVVDEDGTLHRLFGQVRAGKEDAISGRVECSLTLLVNPEREVAFTAMYPWSTGRNWPEFLRTFDSMRITRLYPDLGTWANWQPGGQDGMLIRPSFQQNGLILSDEECEKRFPKGHFECLYPWFRITPIPDLPYENAAMAASSDASDEEEAAGDGRAARPGTAGVLGA